MRKKIGCALVLLLLSAASSSADQIWGWSFADERGTFRTDGLSPVPGTYTMIDFSVTASAASGTLGSISGGEYIAAGSDSVAPYTMKWGGQAGTLWSAAGFNSFNWWPFSDQVQPPKAYLFGFRAGPEGQVNDVHSAALWSGSFPLTQGLLTVAPSGGATVTPEPGTLSMLLLGAGALGARRWRRAQVIP